MSIEKHKAFRLNRLFSGPLSEFLLKTSLTPNQITSLSLLLGISGGVLFSMGSYPKAVLGAFFYELAVILDNCDGDIARAKNLKSEFGAWFDIAADFVTDAAFFLGLSAGLLKMNAQMPVRLFAFLSLSGCAIHFLLVMLEKWKGFGPAVFEAPNPDHAARKNLFFNLFDALREGDSSWFVVLFVLFNQMQFLLWFGGIYMQLLWISAVCLNFRWYRKVSL